MKKIFLLLSVVSTLCACSTSNRGPNAIAGEATAVIGTGTTITLNDELTFTNSNDTAHVVVIGAPANSNCRLTATVPANSKFQLNKDEPLKFLNKTQIVRNNLTIYAFNFVGPAGKMVSVDCNSTSSVLENNTVSRAWCSGGCAMKVVNPVNNVHKINNTPDNSDSNSNDTTIGI